MIAEVEKRVLKTDGLSTVYTRVGEQPRGSQEISEDTIGVIQFEFSDWKTRPKAREIMDQIRRNTADIPGVLVEVAAPRAGPPTGKAVQVQIGALNPDLVPEAAKKVAAVVGKHPGVRDMDDGQPLPGIDWKIDVNRAEAAKYGASPSTVGTAIQLVTNGVKVTDTGPTTTTRKSTSWCAFRKTSATSTRSTNCACRRRLVMCRSAISSNEPRRRALATSIASPATA